LTGESDHSPKTKNSVYPVSFIFIYVILKPYDCLSLMKHKIRYFEKCSGGSLYNQNSLVTNML